MKISSLVALLGLSFLVAVSAQDSATAAGCQTCARSALTFPATAGKPAALVVPRDVETLPQGRIENLMPIGMLTVLGCDTCAAQAVQWALAQGSSREDVDLALRTVAAVQKLDCFRQQFGADVAIRMEKPLAAARKALEESAAPREPEKQALK